MKLLNPLFSVVFLISALPAVSAAPVRERDKGIELVLPDQLARLLSSTQVLGAMHKLAGRGGMMLEGISTKRVSRESWNYVFLYHRSSSNLPGEYGQFTVRAGSAHWSIENVTEPTMVSPSTFAPGDPRSVR